MNHAKTYHPSHPSIEGAGSADVASRVNQLIANGKCKQGVELAKEHYKRNPTSDVQRMLVEAYLARIAQFQAKGAVEDACTLIKLVRERFPAHQSLLNVLEIRAAAANGMVGEFLRPLTQPDVQPHVREAVESVIRREWIDLPALAQCAALPADHPLRTSAQALWQAFQAVTSGPVTEEQISLPEVSRRNPLAGWKLLIRAIAAFYRNDDEGCRRSLAGIAPDAAVARLGWVLTSLVDRAPIDTIRPHAASLQAQVMGSEKSVRDALAKLEKAFESFDSTALSRSIRAALSACESFAPGLVHRLRQRISVRCLVEEVPRDEALRMMGPSLHDAYFWRLSANAYERRGHTQSALAAIHWERFLRHAVHEKLFRADSTEAAAVYLHMANLVAEAPTDQMEEFRRRSRSETSLGAMYRGQPPAIAALAPRTDAESLNVALDPNLLFRKSAELRGDRETFTAWLAWAEREDLPSRQMQELAQLWRRMLPRDPQPLLLLSTLAESRDALKLAMKHLAEAESIDAMNPAVRKARLRLTLSTTWRHLEDKKPRLLEIDLAQLEALPAMHEGDRGLFLDALWAAWHVVRHDSAAAQQAVNQLIEHAGHLLAAALMDSIQYSACLGEQPGWPVVPLPGLLDGYAVVVAEARVRTLASDLELEIERPELWDEFIVEVLKERPSRLSTAALTVLARAAIERQEFRQGYLASGAGLASAAGPAAARFLLLRAQSVEGVSVDRLSQCLRAAMELARQANDLQLIAEISEQVSSYPRTRHAIATGQHLGDELLAEVIRKEREALAYPRNHEEAERYVVTVDSNSNSTQRSGPGAFLDDNDDGDDDQWDDDADDDDEPSRDKPSRRPRGLADALMQIFDELMATFGRIPTIEEVLESDPARTVELFRKVTGQKMKPEEIRQAMKNFRGKMDCFGGPGPYKKDRR